MKIDITPYNENYQPHGLWETYCWYNEQLWHKAFYSNGKRIGYEENNYSDVNKRYYI